MTNPLPKITRDKMIDMLMWVSANHMLYNRNPYIRDLNALNRTHNGIRYFLSDIFKPPLFSLIWEGESPDTLTEAAAFVLMTHDQAYQLQILRTGTISQAALMEEDLYVTQQDRKRLYSDLKTGVSKR